MAINDTHRDYANWQSAWRRIRHAVGGEDAVKDAEMEHLPKPSGQDLMDYHGYLQRSMFYGATGRTVQGLVGAVFRKTPMVDVPDRMRLAMKNVTLTGIDLETFAKTCAEEVLTVGRYGVLVDRSTDENNRPYFRGYEAECINNWRTRNIDGVVKLDQVVLYEEMEVPAEDGFGTEYKDSYRVLMLDADNLYEVRVYVESKNEKGESGFSMVEQYAPSYRGERLDYIPFQFLSPTTLTPDCEKSPILDLVNVNISHYRTTADLEQGNYLTSQPTPYITGIRAEDASDYTIGSGTMWLLPTDAQVGMLEYRGAGLSFLENSLSRKEAMMAMLGARMLEETKRGAEAAETVRLRGSGESSVLSNISSTVSAGLTQCLQWFADWEGLNVEPVIQLNRDFMDSRMGAQELTALVAAWQSGAIPLDDLLYNLQRGEMLRPDYSLDEFKELLENGVMQGMAPDESDEPPLDVVEVEA
jgi:hypothetical protein